MNMTSVEQEKLNFLKGVNHRETSDFLIQVGIFDIGFNLHLNAISREDYQHLCDYYQYFPMPKHPKKTLNIYYYAFQDQRSELSHRWYSSRFPYQHFIPLEERSSFHIIERDYASLFDKDYLKVFAYGPRPGQDNPDSLDNLLTTLFSSLNNEHDCLILHSAAVVNKNKAYIFFGESGAGKSTLAFHCYQNFNQKVISSDQTYLSWDGKKIWAQSTPITIPEIERHSQMREWRPIEVAGFVHLTQNGKVGLKQLDSIDFFKKFICQSDLYLTPLSNQQKFLNMAKSLVGNAHQLGELTYNKNENFWRYFSQEII